MTKVSKDFFTENEIIFVGYSSRNNQYSNSIYQAFTNHDMKVYPVNSKANSGFSIKVYQNLSELPRIPKTAFVLLNQENTKRAVKQLMEAGVKKILFLNSKTVDTETLKECSQQNIETAIGCPLMIFGTGIHKIHAFFAGVK